MQKFRKWTDQATGVNPFISSKKSTPILSLSNLVSLIVIIVKLAIIVIIHPFLIILVLLMFIQQRIPSSNLTIIGKLVRLGWSAINTIIFGIWGADDENFMRNINKDNKDNNSISKLEKGNKMGKLILSNHTSLLDVFYYLSRVENCKFVVSSAQQEKFYVVSGLSLLARLLKYSQPFFQQTIEIGQPYKTLIKQELSTGSNCILFYEGIRTNGLGTIKISNKLSNLLYENQIDFIISHMKYTAKDSIHSVVYHPLRIILEAMGHLHIRIKVRCRSQKISSLNSGNQLQKEIDIFLTANATKLLDTHPKDYYTFIDYYFKSQKDGYTQK